MKLTRKLTLALALGVIFVVAIAGSIQVFRELRLFNDDTKRDHHALALALATAVSSVQRFGGEPEARELVEKTDRELVQLPVVVRWLPKASAARMPAQAKQALASNEVVQVAEPGTQALLTYRGLKGGKTSALLELREPVDAVRHHSRITILSVVGTMVLIAALSILLAYVLGARIVGRPVRQLAEKARAVGRGVLGPPLVVTQNDELGFLAHELNAMCESLSQAREETEREARARERALQQLRHADRLATAGKLAAGVAHELGTPLNVVSGRAKMIQKGEVVDDEARDSARIVAEQATRMTGIIRQLLDFARREPAGKSRSDLRAVAVESCALLRPMAERMGVTLQISESSEAVTALFAFNQMLQALMNLVVNALQASSAGAAVTVETRMVETTPPVEHGGAPGRWACVSVRDQGTGMTPEVAARAFDPFFTTKGVGEGTGLGLSVSYGIVRDSGGWIAMETRPGDGTKFLVYLPVA